MRPRTTGSSFGFSSRYGSKGLNTAQPIREASSTSPLATSSFLVTSSHGLQPTWPPPNSVLPTGSIFQPPSSAFRLTLTTKRFRPPVGHLRPSTRSPKGPSPFTWRRGRRFEARQGSSKPCCYHQVKAGTELSQHGFDLVVATWL